MRHLRFACISVVLVFVAAGRSGADEIDTHVARLADDSFAKRELAQRELFERGESAVPQLRRSLEAATDLEQRSRLEVILKQIAQDAVIGATRVTLSLDAAPVDQAVAAINEQIGTHLLLFPRDVFQAQNAGPVTIHARRQPLWHVLRELCEGAGLDLSLCDDGIRLTPSCGGGIIRSPGCVTGPLLVAAGRVYHQRSIEFTQGSQRTSEFGMQLHVLAEPKLKLMPGTTSVRLLSADDDAGNSLLPLVGQDETYGGSSPYWSFSTRLRYPDSPGAKIRKLTGQITFTAATKFAIVELTDLPAVRNSATDAADATFIVRQITQTGDRYEVGLAAIARPESDAAARMQQLLYTADVRLQDARGQSILRSSGPNFTAAVTPGAIEMTLIFDRNLSDGRPAPGPATRLIWRIPVESKPVTLPFELTDLPMP